MRRKKEGLNAETGCMYRIVPEMNFGWALNILAVDERAVVEG
jgi:hypothetical protein